MANQDNLNYPWTVYSFNALLTSDQPTVASGYDYQINIELNYPLDSLFDARNFVQNGSNSSQIDINLVLNKTLLSARLSEPTTRSSMTNGDQANVITAGISMAPSGTLANRFLEAISLRVFGTAAGSDMILNPLAATNSISGPYVNGLSSVISNNTSTLYTLYDQSGKTDNVNKQQVQNFNFSGISLSFPTYVTGSITTNSSSVDTSGLGLLLGGYNLYGGLGTMTGGQYNIPVRVTVNGT